MQVPLRLIYDKFVFTLIGQWGDLFIRGLCFRPDDADREHNRSGSSNSSQFADMEVTDANGAASASVAAAAAAGLNGAIGGRADRSGHQRDREAGRDTTPLRRLSVPMLSTNSKSTYISLRATPSMDSPAPGERAAESISAVGAGAVVPVAPAITGLHHSFHALSTGGGGGNEAVAVPAQRKGGAQVRHGDCFMGGCLFISVMDSMDWSVP